MKTLNKLFVLIFSIIVLSCTPEAIDGQDGRDGRDGINGIDGANGADGADGQDGQDGADGESGASIGMTVNALGNGCNELTFYYDTNNNKQNDNETVISTITVCDGQDASQVGPQGPQGETGAQGPQGETGATGATGATGPQGQSVALFIETATTEQCTNSGFVVNLFDDNNNDAIYNTGDVLVSTNVICYPDVETIEFPDYSSLGHSMEAIGIWRLYSRRGFPVPEDERYNIKIYPDGLNPNKLTTEGNNQNGYVDIGDVENIPFIYLYGSVNGADAAGLFSLTSIGLPGLTSEPSGYELKWIPSTASEGETPNDYLLLDIPSSNFDIENYDRFLYSNLVFYRIQ